MRFTLLFLFSCGGLDATISKSITVEPATDSAAPEPEEEPDEPEEEEPDPPETDTEPEPDDEDPATLEGTVGYASLSLRQVACPGCLGETAGVTVSFEALFHNPITDSHVSWIPEPGTCIQNLTETSPSVSPTEVGASIEVHGPMHSFTVPSVAYGRYYIDTLYDTQYDRDSIYAVAPAGSMDSFEFTSLSGFDYIEPVEMLYVDASYAFAAPISRSGTTFTWGPSGTASEFMVIVAVYSVDGSMLLGYVTCVGPDNGSMYVPGSYLAYPPDSLVAIHLSRERTGVSAFE